MTELGTSRRSVKVLFFTPSLGVGGAEKHLVRVVNALDRAVFSVSVAVARPGGAYEKDLREDVGLYVLRKGALRSSTGRLLRSVGPLGQLIDAEQPDLLCPVLDAPALVALLAVRLAHHKPKVVICAQNPPSIDHGRRWHPLDRLLLLLIRRFYGRADGIVALSSGVAQDIERLVPAASQHLTVIYNAGVDESIGPLARSPVAEAPVPRPLLVACGRLVEQKGYPYLLQAFARLQERIPAHLWILGTGPLRAQLEAHIDRLGLQDRIRLLGFSTNPFAYMAAADVFVLSSIYEGFGNVIVEAMACGTPVVATDCPFGPGEIIEHRRTGWLVPPRDPEALAEALAMVLEDARLRRALAERGRQRAQDFEAARIARAYGAYFLDVVEAGLEPVNEV